MTMFLYPFMFSLGGDIWDPATGQIYGILNSEANAEGMVWNKRFLITSRPARSTSAFPKTSTFSRRAKFSPLSSGQPSVSP
ncbi:MAG: hypothetical protein U0521_25060 [Anaerolineae bacterium]